MMLFRPADTPADLKLVVGLGNIGSQYAHTRHNVGFDVVDELAHRSGAHFRIGKFKGEEATITLAGRRVLLLKPHTLMNLSGEAVVAAARYYKIPPAQILIICDDVNLPPGKLRVRAKGSDGGHNGLWNIIHRLGAQDFPRIRVGIGESPPEMDRADYVLSRFRPDERPLMHEAITRAADAIGSWITDDLETMMNRFNAPSEEELRRKEAARLVREAAKTAKTQQATDESE